MKHIASMTLALSLGVAAVAQDLPVRMTFSGTSGSSTINLQQPNTGNNEDNFTGTGSLRSFTFRGVRAIENSPTSSSACSGPTKIYFNDPSGSGVFRFVDGSLMYVHLVQGGDCIDFAAQEAHCTLIFQISGGTGRYKNATGMLTFTETSVPVLADSSNNPVYFAATGQFTGTVSGVGREEDSREEQP